MLESNLEKTLCLKISLGYYIYTILNFLNSFLKTVIKSWITKEEGTLYLRKFYMMCPILKLLKNYWQYVLYRCIILKAEVNVMLENCLQKANICLFLPFCNFWICSSYNHNFRLNNCKSLHLYYVKQWRKIL